MINVEIFKILIRIISILLIHKISNSDFLLLRSSSNLDWFFNLYFLNGLSLEEIFKIVVWVIGGLFVLEIRDIAFWLNCLWLLNFLLNLEVFLVVYHVFSNFVLNVVNNWFNIEVLSVFIVVKFNWHFFLLVLDHVFSNSLFKISFDLDFEIHKCSIIEIKW